MNFQQNEESAKLSLKLVAPSGYTTNRSYPVTSDQWALIQQILESESIGSALNGIVPPPRTGKEIDPDDRDVAETWNRGWNACVESIRFELNKLGVKGTRPLINVDPNEVFAKRTFVLTLQQWDYTLTLSTDWGDGFSSIDLLFEEIAEQLVAEQGENPELILTRPAVDGVGQDQLICAPDGDPVEDWLKNLVVSVAIVSIKPEGGAA